VAGFDTRDIAKSGTERELQIQGGAPNKERIILRNRFLIPTLWHFLVIGVVCVLLMVYICGS
jgi:hypothetical protein